MIQSRSFQILPAFLLPLLLTGGPSRAGERPKLAAWVVCDGSAGAPCEEILKVAEGFARAFGDLPSEPRVHSLPAISLKAQPGPGGGETSRVSRYLGDPGTDAGKLVPAGADGLLLFEFRRTEASRPMLAGWVHVVPRSGRWIGASASAVPVEIWNGEGKEKTGKLLLRGGVGGALQNAGLLPSAPGSRPFPTSATAAVYGDAVMEIPPGLFR